VCVFINYCPHATGTWHKVYYHSELDYINFLNEPRDWRLSLTAHSQNTFSKIFPALRPKTAVLSIAQCIVSMARFRAVCDSIYENVCVPSEAFGAKFKLPERFENTAASAVSHLIWTIRVQVCINCIGKQNRNITSSNIFWDVKTLLHPLKNVWGSFLSFSTRYCSKQKMWIRKQLYLRHTWNLKLQMQGRQPENTRHAQNTHRITRNRAWLWPKFSCAEQFVQLHCQMYD
jgi:hypothetical protein